jgi:hypothetical protein
LSRFMLSPSSASSLLTPSSALLSTPDGLNDDNIIFEQQSAIVASTWAGLKASQLGDAFSLPTTMKVQQKRVDKDSYSFVFGGRTMFLEPAPDVPWPMTCQPWRSRIVHAKMVARASSSVPCTQSLMSSSLTTSTTTTEAVDMCRSCGQTGHSFKTCYHKKKTCARCGCQGHIVGACREKPLVC